MFYDIIKPNSFVSDIKNILSKDGIWVMEQSYLPLLLRDNAYDSICHEHLTYFTLKQINYLCSKNDLRIFPYLLVVIPAQIIGYGLGFILNFIKRYILNQGSWTGFNKRYYA